MKDEVYISTPINKTAALVVQKDNDRQIDGKEQWHEYMSLIKPPIRSSTFSNKAHDLTGTKVGKFTVIGMFIRQNPKKNARWVVQCTCGYYTIRSGKAIRKHKDHIHEAECERCKYNSNLSKY